MKKGILFLLLMPSVFVQAQSLKDALYGGKLKNEAGTVIRKGDDLASKIDTAQRKTITDETGKAKPTLPAVDSAQRPAIQTDSAGLSVVDRQDDTASGATDTVASEVTPASNEVAAAAPKSNNALWKAYADSVASTLKTEVLSSKKVKRGSYYVLVSYVIETDGQTSVSDVFLSPENSFLQQQIKDRLAVDTPRLSPVLTSTGTPRKVTKKYSFTLSKE